MSEGSLSWGELTGAFSHSCYTAKGLYLGEKTVPRSPHGRVDLLEDMGVSVQRGEGRSIRRRQLLVSL